MSDTDQIFISGADPIPKLCLLDLQVYRERYRMFTQSLVFLDFDEFLNILLEMCIISYHLHYHQKEFKNIHARPVTESPKLRYYTPYLPLRLSQNICM